MRRRRAAPDVADGGRGGRGGRGCRGGGRGRPVHLLVELHPLAAPVGRRAVLQLQNGILI